MERKYWKWKNYHFETLQFAKNCIEGDFNGNKELLEFYNKIWHIVDNQHISYVQITIGKDGYVKFSKVNKICAQK